MQLFDTWRPDGAFWKESNYKSEEYVESDHTYIHYDHIQVVKERVYRDEYNQVLHLYWADIITVHSLAFNTLVHGVSLPLPPNSESQ